MDITCWRNDSQREKKRRCDWSFKYIACGGGEQESANKELSACRFYVCEIVSCLGLTCREFNNEALACINCITDIPGKGQS